MEIITVMWTSGGMSVPHLLCCIPKVVARGRNRLEPPTNWWMCCCGGSHCINFQGCSQWNSIGQDNCGVTQNSCLSLEEDVSVGEKCSVSQTELHSEECLFGLLQSFHRFCSTCKGNLHDFPRSPSQPLQAPQTEHLILFELLTATLLLEEPLKFKLTLHFPVSEALQIRDRLVASHSGRKSLWSDHVPHGAKLALSWT